ncbi:M12 family metallopeptidase [Streptomyces sp. NPDC002054]|uniref:M12 family metallopeptidase n=1 Tax=Streptomyces sp. NPDC002054 TaxID=3154663 RepID=UPI0033261909
MADNRGSPNGIPLYCAQPPQTKPVLRPDLSPDRARAILVGRSKWLNGTVLHYCFFDEPGAGGGGGSSFSKIQLDEVRSAFEEWKNVGIGLDFVEVEDPADSEVRIGFQQGDGSWSYVGKDALGISRRERTMNFGWDLTSPHGQATARHEIGHLIGNGHEHQNPFAGIVWDEEAVFEELGGPPNNWPRQTTFHNVLRKLSTEEVEGSTWDPDSIMQYGFPAGLILQPEKYRAGIDFPLTLSATDKEFVQKWYPPLGAAPRGLKPFQSAELDLSSGGQVDFEIVPAETRNYELRTFGDSDILLVLFENVDGEPRFLTGVDDSGVNNNGQLTVKLFQGRRYVARARLYSAWGTGNAAFMYW